MALLNTNIGPERVQVIDQPIGTVQVQGAGISVAGILISTAKVGAPENAATRVTNMTDFVALFGDADDINYDGYYAVKGFFDNGGTGNTAIIVNVGATPVGSLPWIGDGAAGTGLRALDTSDDLSLLMVPGLPLETAYLVQKEVISYAETIRQEYGALLTTVFSLNAIPKEISFANKEELVHTTKFLTVTGAGPFVLTVEDVLAGAAADLSAVKPGMIVSNLAATFKAVVTAVSDGSDSITIAVDPTTSWVAADSVFIRLPSAISYKEFVINNPSRLNAWYFNSVLVTDEDSLAVAGSVIPSDPTGHVAGVMARMDANNSIGGPSHAPAGLRYAGISGIQGLALAISERLDGEPLRKNFVNRLTSFPGAGNVIFGAYTSDSGTSALYTADEQNIGVMRTLQFIKKSLEPGLRSFLWENFSPVVQAQIAGSILSFLRNNTHLFPAGLPESQQFKVISVEPTQNELDQGLLRVRVQVKPNKAVKFIEVALEFPIPAA